METSINESGVKWYVSVWIQTGFSGLWIKELAIELKDVSGGEASSTEAPCDFARCDDVRMHPICCPPPARIYWAPCKREIVFGLISTFWFYSHVKYPIERAFRSFINSNSNNDCRFFTRGSCLVGQTSTIPGKGRKNCCATCWQRVLQLQFCVSVFAVLKCAKIK